MVRFALMSTTGAQHLTNFKRVILYCFEVKTNIAWNFLQKFTFLKSGDFYDFFIPRNLDG